MLRNAASAAFLASCSRARARARIAAFVETADRLAPAKHLLDTHAQSLADRVADRCLASISVPRRPSTRGSSGRPPDPARRRRMPQRRRASSVGRDYASRCWHQRRLEHVREPAKREVVLKLIAQLPLAADRDSAMSNCPWSSRSGSTDGRPSSRTSGRTPPQAYGAPYRRAA
jgi:hypothetical protein